MSFRRNKPKLSDDRRATLTKELEEVKKEIRERLLPDYDQLNQNLADALFLVYKDDKSDIVENKVVQFLVLGSQHIKETPLSGAHKQELTCIVDRQNL